MSVRQAALRWVLPIHRGFRLKKASLFLDLIAPGPTGLLLDVGGGTGMSGEFRPVYERFDSVTVINLEPPNFDLATMPTWKSIRGDGCQMPFPSKSFDWVFSNAVIEHVGGWDRQKAFANEIRRVAARGYFVTTPDKYFPVEPHTLCPFYQYLPVALQKRIAPYTPGYLTQYEEINLLSRSEFQVLFPEAEIKRVGFPIWGNSLVAACRYC